MSENCPKCGSPRTKFEGQTSWECGSYQSLIGGSHIKTPAFKLIESEHCQCRTALAAATNRAEDLQAHYDRDTAKLQQEIARLTAANGGNYWRWQGDGGDYLESLTCPILIDVGQLHEIFSVNREAVVRADDAEAKLAQSTNYVADHDTYPTCVWFANGRVVSVNAAGVLEIRFGKQLEACDE